MSSEYIKHLVECNCILPHLQEIEPVVFHKFVVFSELEDETADVVPSIAECNNCGAIHRVTEISTSEILRKESSRAFDSIDDIELELPEKIANILRRYECELHVWQEAKFIVNHELWGRFVVLSKERNEDTILGKALVIFGQNLVKVENFEQLDGLI